MEDGERSKSKKSSKSKTQVKALKNFGAIWKTYVKVEKDQKDELLIQTELK